MTRTQWLPLTHCAFFNTFQKETIYCCNYSKFFRNDDKMFNLYVLFNFPCTISIFWNKVDTQNLQIHKPSNAHKKQQHIRHYGNKYFITYHHHLQQILLVLLVLLQIILWPFKIFITSKWFTIKCVKSNWCIGIKNNREMDVVVRNSCT